MTAQDKQQQQQQRAMDVPVPLFLWHHAPSHAATVVAASRSADVVATGDASGGVYLWSARAQWVGAPVRPARARAPSASGPSAADGYAPDEVVPLPPFALLARHSAAIAVLVFARDGPDELLLSVDAAGAGALWDARDGSVIRQFSSLLPELALASEGTRAVSCCGGALVVVGDGTGGSVHGLHVVDVPAARLHGARAGASSRGALMAQRRASMGSAVWTHSAARVARAAAERCVGVLTRSEHGSGGGGSGGGGGSAAPGARSGSAWWFGAAGAVRRYAWEAGGGDASAPPRCELVSQLTLALPDGAPVVAAAGLRGGSLALIVTPTSYAVIDAAASDEGVLLQRLAPLPALLRSVPAAGVAVCATREVAAAVVWCASGAAACFSLDNRDDAAAPKAPRPAVSLALDAAEAGAGGNGGGATLVCARANALTGASPVFVASTGGSTKVWTVAPPEGEGAGPLPRVALAAAGVLAMGANLDADDASRGAPGRLGACTAALVVQPETLGELDFGPGGGDAGSASGAGGAGGGERPESPPVEIGALMTPYAPRLRIDGLTTPTGAAAMAASAEPLQAQSAPDAVAVALGDGGGGGAGASAGAATGAAGAPASAAFAAAAVAAPVPIMRRPPRAPPSAAGTLDPSSDDEDMHAQIAAGARAASTAKTGAEAAKTEGGAGGLDLARQESDANSELTDNFEDDVESEDIARESSVFVLRGYESGVIVVSLLFLPGVNTLLLPNGTVECDDGKKIFPTKRGPDSALENEGDGGALGGGVANAVISLLALVRGRFYDEIDRHLFVSGHADGTVRLWSIAHRPGALDVDAEFCFHSAQHTAPVKFMSRPASGLAVRKHIFSSVGEDNVVIIYSAIDTIRSPAVSGAPNTPRPREGFFGDSSRSPCTLSVLHRLCAAAPITRLLWLIADSYVVTFADEGAVASFWHLRTGRLERRVADFVLPPSVSAGASTALETKASCTLMVPLRSVDVAGIGGGGGVVEPYGSKFALEVCALAVGSAPGVRVPAVHMLRLQVAELARRLGTILNSRESNAAMASSWATWRELPAETLAAISSAVSTSDTSTPMLAGGAAAASAAAAAAGGAAPCARDFLRMCSYEARVLGLLLPWGIDAAVDARMSGELGFERPLHTVSFGLLQARSRSCVTLLLPGVCAGVGAYQLSPQYSALHGLALCALLMPYAAAQLPWSGVAARIATFAVRDVWSSIPRHSQALPSLRTLGEWGAGTLRASDGIRAVRREMAVAARRVLRDTVEAMTTPARSTLVTRWSGAFMKLYAGADAHGGAALQLRTTVSAIKHTITLAGTGLVRAASPSLAAAASHRGVEAADKGDAETHEDEAAEKYRGRVNDPALHACVLVLSVLGICSPGHVEPTTAKRLFELLVRMLLENQGRSLAIHLLGRGYALWQPYVDANHLRDVIGALANVKGELEPEARLAAVHMGRVAPVDVLSGIESWMRLASSATDYTSRCKLLGFLTMVCKENPTGVLPHLELAVSIIAAEFDPRDMEARNHMQRDAALAMRAIVTTFPMASFNKSTQRFAVGTVGHKVVIFDIKLGGVWRTLIGHTNAITCVGFSSDGRYLLSYSADESAVRVWNIHAGGMFGSMLQAVTMHHKTNTVVSLPNLRKGRRSIGGGGGGGGGSGGGGDAGDGAADVDWRVCKLNFVTDLRVELTREDGSIAEVKIPK